MYAKYSLSKLSELNEYYESEHDRQIQAIADRYEAESKLLSAVSLGNEEGAVKAFYAYSELMTDPLQVQSPTSSDPIRDFKNSMQVINTLFRKSVESNSVHPVYLHRSSSYFGAEIEKTQSLEEMYEILKDMLHTYCEIVKQCSLASYSRVIQEALLFIDMNLSSPISTRDIAANQFVTPNYLSTRFKQEVGLSISDYLLDRRVELSCHLLSSTALSIQEISQKVGLDDASYFSKQFKKKKGISPLQYRKANTC